MNNQKAIHDMCMRLKSGREFRFTCEDYTIKRDRMTQELAEAEFKNVRGECPKFFKIDDIESISEYIEDGETIGEKPKKGEWIVLPPPDDLHCGFIKCPFCGEELVAEPNEYSFCPSCGAEMRI